MKSLLAAFLAVNFLPPAYGATSFNEKRQRITNDCRQSGRDCGLKAFWLEANDWSVTLSRTAGGGKGYGTRMIACYETQTMDDLRDYGLVQFIRGCQYRRSKTPEGVYRQFETVTNAGRKMDFRFSDWTLELNVSDPLDWGGDPDQKDRHFYYWNDIPHHNEPKGRDFFGFEKPAQPKLCVRDTPGAVLHSRDGLGRNISLQFRTCLYRAAEVPTNVSPDNLGFAAPIHCFDWASSFSYNVKTRRYERLPDIDPKCDLEPGLE